MITLSLCAVNFSKKPKYSIRAFLQFIVWCLNGDLLERTEQNVHSIHYTLVLCSMFLELESHQSIMYVYRYKHTWIF